MKITKEQQQAIKRKFEQSNDNAVSYLEFRRRVKPAGFCGDPLIALPWCGMRLGIEADGYTHCLITNL